MTSDELRKKFLEFFKKRGHTIVPSSSLLPSDPSVLLTTAGMQQFKPYFTGKANPLKDFGSKNTASVQKSFRTSDIDEVGDESHLTFFEMLGNFSFGGYWKKEAIQYAYDFMKEISLEIDYVTVFDPEKVPEGDWRKNGVPFDKESYEIWKKIGIPEAKIHREGVDNFWGPTGNEGPCGPTTEIYVNGVEIWNIVFNQFYCDKDKKLAPLEIQGIDTGMGLERLAMVSQNKNNIFETDLFNSLIDIIPSNFHIRKKRIFVDHSRAIVFLLADGVQPSNKEAGYVLRRLMRRLIAYEDILAVGSYRDMDHLSMGYGLSIRSIIEKVVEIYQNEYKELKTQKDFILEEFEKERKKFSQTLHNGLKEFEGMLRKTEGLLSPRGGRLLSPQNIISGDEAFHLYESFGFPFELIKEFAAEKSFVIDESGFKMAMEKHQEISRAGQERKFGGHGLLLDTGELKAANEQELKIVTRLHTTTHLLQAALRKVLGENVHQAGSDITTERTRFDFTFDRKLAPEEIKKVEDLINEAAQKNLSMGFELMPFAKAIESGALYSPKERYPETVKVYTAKDQNTGEVFSKELCGGPHVAHTGEIGRVKIIKEEAASAGVRRIRAVLA